MTGLKLGRLPDRSPVRVTICLVPDLHRDLHDYADAYEAAYGQKESLAELIPAMLATFLESDRGFARSRKSKAAGS